MMMQTTIAGLALMLVVPRLLTILMLCVRQRLRFALGCAFLFHLGCLPVLADPGAASTTPNPTGEALVRTYPTPSPNLRRIRLPLVRPVATAQSDSPSDIHCVVDGVDSGPKGWSIPKYSLQTQRPQSLVVSCAKPILAEHLEINLFFLAGRPYNALAEFALSSTTDPEPTLKGRWQPVEIIEALADQTKITKTAEGHLQAAPVPVIWTRNVPDDVYRIHARIPSGRVTGFRLDVFPVQATPSSPTGFSWNEPYNFTLTEFWVAERVPETTNIALFQPAMSSSPLFKNENGECQSASALTDGRPATIAHPNDGVDPEFFFEIDLGRIAKIDHVGLRNRGDVGTDRMSRVLVQWFTELDRQTPSWRGISRADGTHPDPGSLEIVRQSIGQGVFRGRYLRLSSLDTVPLSPQFAEVEVYESRIPEIETIEADGSPIPVTSPLVLPPGIRRLAVKLRIPQVGMPPDVLLRWRVSGDLDAWQESRLLTIDMPCPPPGRTFFEAQALHSDGEWNQAICRLPIDTSQYLWESSGFQAVAAVGTTATALGLGLFLARRRSARQLALMKSQAALAAERARIARDLHDDLGSDLSGIAMLADLAKNQISRTLDPQPRLDEIGLQATQSVRRLEEIVWAINPENDTVEDFVAFFCKHAQSYLELAGVAARFDVPDTLPTRSLPSARRHHLYLAAKEAIRNAVRHGSPGTVTIRIAMADEWLNLSISDDGCGFVESVELTSAHGSANMAIRMRNVGGTYHRHSQPGCGTTVEFSVPT